MWADIINEFKFDYYKVNIYFPAILVIYFPNIRYYL